MRFEAVEKVARAVLYEGYILYPYRASAVKNRQRFTFGGVYPRAFAEAQAGSEAWTQQTEVLARGGGAAVVEVRLRFLHLAERSEPGRLAWHEAAEREVAVPALGLAALAREGPRETAFAWGASLEREGPVVRRREAIAGALVVAAKRLSAGLFRLTVRVRNLTPGRAGPRDEALLCTLAATHTLMGIEGGEFVSLLDPPDDLRHAAAACRNEGTFPVLAGPDGARDVMLSSPIILYDYPRTAVESPGDLFDATEIDEILTLRILTLTDEEKRAVRETDARARALLERTEALSARDLERLHGALRDAPPGGLRRGARVRLRPRRRADGLDVILAGRLATIVAIERDLEDRLHVAVTVDDDPGRDLGAAGMPGHRFFFAADEVEVL